MNIYVGNLAFSITEESVREVFEAHGEVASVKLISDRETGRAKGFGFVDMPNDDEAKTAIEALDGAELEGRNMRVNESKPRPQGGGGFGGGGGRGRGGQGGYGGGGRRY